MSVGRIFSRFFRQAILGFENTAEESNTLLYLKNYFPSEATPLHARDTEKACPHEVCNERLRANRPYAEKLDASAEEILFFKDV